MTHESQALCAYCAQGSDQVPLLELTYRQEKAWICSTHLPVLIHKPERLMGKLPGAEHIPRSDSHGGD